jgi:sucrose-6F-phosphate phosphohydrolase
MLIPFTRARRAPVMIVTDLDGTLIGDGPEFDEGTHEFKQYWEDSAGLAGGLLVFNTGRSIGQVVALFTEKAGYMAIPNYIITAVGTKIFERNKKYDHTTVEGWQECESWASELEQGWDLQRVREVVEGQIQANPNQAHWLDRGTEHPHRCSLSAEHSVLERVLPGLRTAFNEQGLDVKIIVSGMGDWRYVDCVSAGGGKLEALEWVRRRVGLPAEHCVACGDSGNDVLMLEGKNPAIVVGNAQPDLVDWVMDQPQTGRVFLASKKGARGILEGLAGLALW